MAVENGDVPPSRACQGLRPVPDPSAPDLKPVSDLRFSVHISSRKMLIINLKLISGKYAQKHSI